MAKLHKFTALNNEDLENGESNLFENPSYMCDLDDREEPKHAVQFSPPKKRCTRGNFAVVIFILAAGGLAVFLIVKFAQDNYDADPTPRPRLGETITKTSDTSLFFDVTIRLSNQIWTNDFLNTNSEAYRNLSNSFKQQIKEGLNETEIGPYLSDVFIIGIRNGSIIIDVLIQLKAPSSSSSLLSSLKNATDRAKSSGLLPLLADVDTESINISLYITPTSSPTTTTVIKNTTSSEIQSSSSSSSSAMTTNSMTTTTTTSPSKNETTIISSTLLMSTSSTTPTTFPCNNSEYLTNILISQCLNTTQLDEVKQSTDDVKCNFVLTSIDCVLDKIQEKFNLTCSEADKTAAAKEFSSVVQSSIGINPEICITPSTSLPPPMMTTTAMKIISPCDNSEYLTNTLINQCLNTTQLSEVSQSTDDVKCNFVLASIDCVLDQIQKEHNVTCSEADKNAAAKEFSSVVQSSIGINPEICLIPSTSGPPPLMTTTTKIINPCNNSEYLTNTLLAHCFNTSQHSEVSQSADNVKCNFVIASIDCVLNQIQMDFNITCSEADTMAAAKEFSSIVQASIGINPEICLSTSPLTPTSTHMANVTTGASTVKPSLPASSSSSSTKITTMLSPTTTITTFLPRTTTTTSPPKTISTTLPSTRTGTQLLTTTKTTMSTSETMTTTSSHTSPSSPTTRTAKSSTKTTRTTPSLTTASSTTTSSLPETLTTLSPTSSSTTRKTTIFIPTIMTTTTLSPTTTKMTTLSKETTTTTSSPTKMTTTMSFPTKTTTFSSSTTTPKPSPTTITMSKLTTSSPITSSTMTTEMVSSIAKTSPSSPPTWTSMLSPTTIRTTSATLLSTTSTTLSPTTSTNT